MRHLRPLLVVLLGLASGAHAGEAEQVFEQVRASIVSVDTQDEGNRPEGQGSGVVAGPGKVVTNCHVIEDASRIRVAWRGKTLDATLLRQAAAHDLCLLEVAGLDAPAVALRKRAELRVGEEAYAVGNPLGLELTVSAGLISALPGPDKEALIHTSAPLSPGSSGGGLFDGRGRLIGITTGVFRYAQNFNTAQPADRVEALLASKEPLPAPAAVPAAEPAWQQEVERLHGKGDWSGLQALAERRLAAYPNSAQARVHLGAALNGMGKKDAALRLYQEAIAIDPFHFDAWLNQAATLRSLERYAEAESAVRKALAISHEQSAPAWQVLGEILYFSGKLDDALPAVAKAARMDPGNPATWSWVGHILSKQNRPAEAEKAYRKALRLNPNDVNTRKILAELQLITGKDKEAAESLANIPPEQRENAATQIAIGFSEQKQGRLAEAEQAWRKALELDPKALDAWFNLGWLYNKLSRFEEAEASLAKAVKLNPNAHKTLALLALTQTSQGKFRESEQSWLLASQLNPEEVEYWLGLAQVRSRINNFSGMATALRRVLKLAPDNVDAWANLATARFKLGRDDVAEEAARQALSLDPKHPQALNVMANIHGKRGQHDQALAYLDKAVAAHPGDTNAWNNKGYALLKTGRIDAAIKTFETAVRLQPDFAASWINLGEAKLRKSQNAVAIQTLNQAIKLAPNAWDARLYLAEAYLKTLQPGAAREHLLHAAKLNPKHPLVWQRLGEMHLALGDKPEARLALEKLEQLDSTAAASLKARLAEPAGGAKRKSR